VRVCGQESLRSLCAIVASLIYVYWVQYISLHVVQGPSLDWSTYESAAVAYLVALHTTLPAPASFGYMTLRTSMHDKLQVNHFEHSPLKDMPSTRCHATKTALLAIYFSQMHDVAHAPSSPSIPNLTCPI
jgi:hypothetical protein